MTPAPGGVPRASFAWLYRTSFIVQSRTLPRGQNREESDRQFREERSSLYRTSFPAQFAGLCYGLLGGDSGSLWPGLQSRQQSGLCAGQSPDLPAGLCRRARIDQRPEVRERSRRSTTKGQEPELRRRMDGLEDGDQKPK